MDELRIVLNADEQLRVDMQDETPLTLNLQNAEIHTVSTNYAELDNKPQINGVTLVGNKSNTDLNLVNRTGDTMSGVLKTPNPEIYDSNYPQLRFKETASANADALVYFDRSQGARRFSFKQFASASDSYGEVYALPPTTGTLNADVAIDIMTSKGGTMTGTLLAPTMKVYDASYPMFVLQSSAADTSALGAVYENIANRQLVLRQRSTQGYIEDYYLPVNSATSANQSYEILTGKDGVLAYKDQTVSVSLSANTWTEMTVTQQVAPTGYTPLTRTIADGSTTAIRGYLFLAPNNMGNTAHILLFSTQAVTGTFTLRTWFVKTSAAIAL